MLNSSIIKHHIESESDDSAKFVKLKIKHNELSKSFKSNRKERIGSHEIEIGNVKVSWKNFFIV